MEGKFKLKDVGQMSATLSVTATVAEWKSIAAGLNASGSTMSCHDLSAIIKNLVRAAEQEFIENRGD